MDMLQLEYFLEVARKGNMTVAANTLHVAQSSVSRSISRLEENLGVPLFERSGRGIVLNDYGKIFYKSAEIIMREMAEGKQEIKELRDRHLGRIAIATSAVRQINHLMMQYMEENPDVLIRQQMVLPLNDVKMKLDTGEIDYALTYSPLTETEYEWTPLINERYYILMPYEHTLMQLETIRLEDIAKEHILINGSNNPNFIEERFNENGLQIMFSLITDEYDLLGPMVERGLGVAFLSTLEFYDMKKFLPFEHFQKIGIREIENKSFERTLGILKRKHHYLSAAAKSFYKRLIRYFRQVEMELNDW